ncbi:phage tail assembly chaperone, partial [Oenococcus oeni]
MKITVKEFQSQPFEVKTSNRNVQKALKIQLKMNEADDIADKSTEEVLKGRQ